MPWPTPQEYNEAIQDPARCFIDPDLRAAAPDMTPLGLPRPVTGNFASVYRLRRGGRDWAVRCFFRAADDLAARYSAIGGALAGTRLPCTVGFSYVERGILVLGRWYPILKMDWVDGDMLSPWIARHLEDARALTAAAQRWRRMVESLERHGIAHGDLQHGNVVVTGRDIRLVDYDGMYVPALAGLSSSELGHPNYQHPRRNEHHFGPTLDRFSAWLIYGSLLALAEAPDLWDGDECLILRGPDLRAPDRSAIIARLESHQAAAARSLGAKVRELLALDPEAIPPLTALAQAAPRRSGPSWLEDHLPRPHSFRIGPARRVPVGIAVVVVVGSVAAGSLPALIAACVALVVLPLLLFAADPLVIARGTLMYRARRAAVALSIVEVRYERLRSRREALEERHDAAIEHALARKRLVASSRYPQAYKNWRTAQLDRRIVAILTRHATSAGTIARRCASIAADEQGISRTLNALRGSLALYEDIDLRHFIRALFRMHPS